MWRRGGEREKFSLGYLMAHGVTRYLHFVPDDILSRSQLRGDGESVDRLVRSKDICRGPFTVGGFAGLGDFEPYSAVKVTSVSWFVK